MQGSKSPVFAMQIRMLVFCQGRTPLIEACGDRVSDGTETIIRAFDWPRAGTSQAHHEQTKEKTMRTVLLFFMGVPIPILILYNIFY